MFLSSFMTVGLMGKKNGQDLKEIKKNFGAQLHLILNVPRRCLYHRCEIALTTFVYTQSERKPDRQINTPDDRHAQNILPTHSLWEEYNYSWVKTIKTHFVYCKGEISFLQEKKFMYTCRLLNIANRYWKTTASSLTENTPNNQVIPKIGSNIMIPLSPAL